MRALLFFCLAACVACGGGSSGDGDGTLIPGVANAGGNDDRTDCGGCDADEVCNGAGRCVAVGGSCEGGCQAGTYCDLNSSTCVAGCLSDDACPEQTWCDPQSRRCVAGCRSTADCGADESCEDHSCVALDAPPQATEQGEIEGSFTTRIVDPATGGWMPADITGMLESRSLRSQQSVALLDEVLGYPMVVVLAAIAPSGTLGQSYVQLFIPAQILRTGVEIPLFRGTVSQDYDGQSALLTIIELTDPQGQDGITVAQSISGRVRLSAADARPGGAIEGVVEARLTRTNYSPGCYGSCVQVSPRDCQGCFATQRACIEQNGCMDSACYRRFCESAHSGCVDAECDTAFQNCRRGC